MTISANMNVMRKAVFRASSAMVRDFGEVENLQVSRKGTNDFVSAADLKAEKKILETLQDARPEYGFLMEESGVIEGKDKEFRWIVDPLDGTTNFLHGLPFFAISIALEQTLSNGRKEIVAALTHAPMLKETFWAEKGHGAWIEYVNSSQTQRLRVAGRTTLSEALVCVAGIKDATTQLFGHTMQSPSIRSIGSSTLGLAYTACGRFDVFAQEKAHYWDIAAGILLIKEAGGYIDDFQGGQSTLKSGDILAGSDVLVDKTIRALKKKHA